jgi:hypothetical protein
MKVYFSKIKYMNWMIANGQSEKLLIDELNNNEDWVNALDGKDISSREVPATQEIKNEYNVETIFIINRYNDFAEWTGRIVLHPDWIEREN